MLIAGGYPRYLPTTVINTKNGQSCNVNHRYKGWGAVGGTIEDTPIICGGYYNGYLATCYKAGEDSPFGQMSTVRGYAAAQVIDGALWITGGSDGNKRLQTTELMSKEGTSRIAIPLPMALGGHCLVTLDTHVILTGGSSNSGYEKKTFKLRKEDIDSNNGAAWEEGPDLLEARGYHGCTNIDQLAIVAGGWNGNGILASVEVFDGKKWMPGKLLKIFQNKREGSFFMCFKSMFYIGGL